MSKTFSRRTFLKLSGMTAATVAVSGSLPKLMTWAGSNLEGATEFLPSVCEMCVARCPIQAKVVDGKGVMINGNPNWAGSGGTVCARGGAGFSQLYDPQRVQKPMIRTGKRGEGKWKEVSWEEAISYIADKMQEIKTKYGPESVAFSSKPGTHFPFFVNLAKAYGSPNIFTHDSTCPQSRVVAMEQTFGTKAYAVDYANTKYLMLIGRNHFEGIHVTQARSVMNAIGKGAKVVTIDPRFSVTAAKSHEWHPVKPGTDLALVLAINHILVRDSLYDQAFVEKYTEGFAALKASLESCTPEWAAKETGIKATDIERMAKEMAAAKPRAVIDNGWRTTTTPEEFELRRAILINNVLLGNIEVPGGTFFVKNAAFINGMVGKPIIQPLAGGKLPSFPKPAKPRIDGAGVKGHPNYLAPSLEGVVHVLPEVILTEQPYPIKGWIVHRHNPVTTLPNTEKTLEAMQKLDLVVVCDINMADTAWYADVVLPESTYLERDEPFMDYSGLVPVYTLRQQVVKPIFDTKSKLQIFKMLAAKLGLEAYFPAKDVEQVRSAQLGGRADLLKMGKEKGIVNFGMKPLYLRDRKSVAEFVKKFPEAQSLVNEEGIIDKPLTNLKTRSKKIELVASEAQELFGRGVPVYRPVKLAEKDELVYTQGKVAIHSNGHTHNVPWLNELMPTARVWMNPATAAKYGVKTDDKVEISSKYGKTTGEVLVTEGIRPDTIFSYFGFGRLSPGLKRAYQKGPNTGMLLSPSVSPVSGSALGSVGVTVKKV